MNEHFYEFYCNIWKVIQGAGVIHLLLLVVYYCHSWKMSCLGIEGKSWNLTYLTLSLMLISLQDNFLFTFLILLIIWLVFLIFLILLRRFLFLLLLFLSYPYVKLHNICQIRCTLILKSGEFFFSTSSNLYSIKGFIKSAFLHKDVT